MTHRRTIQSPSCHVRIRVNSHSKPTTITKKIILSFWHFIKIKNYNRKLYSIRTNYGWTNFYDYIPHLREVPFNHRQFTSQWSEKFSLIVLNISDFSYLQHHPHIPSDKFNLSLDVDLNSHFISSHKTSNQMEAIPENRAREIFINISF